MCVTKQNTVSKEANRAQELGPKVGNLGKVK